jgi:dienelactone hydrolase
LKIKLLSIFLVLSFLANGFTILVLVLLINQSHHISQLKKQKNEIAHQLSQVQAVAATKITEFMSPYRVSRQVFMSHADNHEDCFGLAPPTPSPYPGGFTLIVYLHGLGSSFLEPFIYPSRGSKIPIGVALTERYPGTIMLSCSYRREGSFGNDLALADITQNIRQVCQQYPIKKIILFGESMGGMTVLNYGATAPGDIQAKLAGIVSIEGTGDLTMLYKETIPGIRIAMEKVYGSPQQNPQVYLNKSFNHNVHRLPQRVRVALISASHDRIVPPNLQLGIYEALKSNNNPAMILPFDSDHGFPTEPMMVQCFDFANQ